MKKKMKLRAGRSKHCLDRIESIGALQCSVRREREHSGNGRYVRLADVSWLSSVYWNLFMGIFVVALYHHRE